MQSSPQQRKALSKLHEHATRIEDPDLYGGPLAPMGDWEGTMDEFFRSDDDPNTQPVVGMASTAPAHVDPVEPNVYRMTRLTCAGGTRERHTP